VNRIRQSDTNGILSSYPPLFSKLTKSNVRGLLDHEQTGKLLDFGEASPFPGNTGRASHSMWLVSAIISCLWTGSRQALPHCLIHPSRRSPQCAYWLARF
jgi:hypothetical protein